MQPPWRHRYSGLSPRALTQIERAEHQVLLGCARSTTDAETRAHTRALLQQGLDWSYLLRLAERHGLLSLIYPQLATTGPEVVPAESLERLHYRSHAYRLQNVFRTQVLSTLLQHLKAQQVRCLPFKGPVLEAAYGNGVREFADLDLLVNPPDWCRTRELLMARGYQLQVMQSWECCLVDANCGVFIDLHQGITGPRFPVTLDFEQLWQRRSPVMLAGEPIDTLSAEDMLLTQCVHLAKDGALNRYTLRLIKLCDIAELLRSGAQQLDWDYLTQEAAYRGCRRILLLGLYLAHQLLEAPVPTAQRHQAVADPSIAAVASQLVAGLFHPGDPPQVLMRPDPWIYFRLRERWRDTLAPLYTIFKRWLQPNVKDRALLPLPASLAWLYYAIRPLRLAREYGKRLFNRFRPNKGQ